MATLRTPTDRRTAAFIADDLRRRIATEQLAPGSRIESEQALCQRFGVCRATVTKALRQLQREGLLFSEHGRGRFVADKPARPRTWTMGLILTDFDYLTHPNVAGALAGAKDALRDLNYHVKLIAINESSQQCADWISIVDPDALDGAIVMSRMIPMHNITELAGRVATVWLAGNAVGELISSVGPDMVGGSFDATDHLLQLGHRRIGLITIRAGYQQGRDQTVGARLAMRSRNRAETDLSIYTAHRNRADDGKRLALEALQSKNRPTALFCGSDEFAIGAYQAADQLGLAVPRDLSIVTWNDVRADALPMPTTAVAVDTRDHATAAAQHLVDLVDDKASRGTMIELPTILHPRESTASLSQ